MGVIVVGYGQGEAFKVCVNKDKCRTHWGKEITAREKRQKARERGEPGETRLSRQQEYEQQAKQEKEEQANIEARREHWKKALPKILGQVADRIRTAPATATSVLADIVLQCVTPWNAPKNAADYLPRGKSAEDLIRHAAFIVLHSEASEWNGYKEFPKLAKKAFSVDVQKILDEAAPVEKAEKPEAGKKAKKGKAA